MPSFDLSNNSLRYSSADESTIERCVRLLSIMSNHDQVVMQEASTALANLKALQKYVGGKRKKAETPAAK